MSRPRGVVTAMDHATSAAPSFSGISLLNAEDSAALDVDLMQTPGFSIDQVRTAPTVVVLIVQ